jgi:hypothetical protein
MRSLLRRRAVRLALFIPPLMPGWAASAGAGLPPLPPPPITLPTVTVPTVTVPTVTVPPVPQPPVPKPPQAPPPPTVPGVSVPSAHPPLPPPAAGDGTSSSGGTPAAPSGSPGTGGSGGVSPQSRRAEANRARRHTVRLTRDWISIRGPKKQRRTTLSFVLREPALVEFVVVRVSPDCRHIGRFRVHGNRGINRIRLRASIQGHSLTPGTYRFVARALPGRRTVVDTRLVVVQRSSRREIRAARHANACPRATDSGTGAISAPTDLAVGSRRNGAGDKAAVPARRRGVLGKKFTGTFAPPAGIPLWLIVLSMLAVGLLLTAALHPRATPRELVASLALGMTGVAVVLLVTLVLVL